MTPPGAPAALPPRGGAAGSLAKPVLRRLLGAGLLAALCNAPLCVHAGILRACDSPTPLSAAQQSTLLRFADVIKTTLDAASNATGSRLALVARSGTDLARVGLRYSHAGISLRASPNAPWSVRQLYFACDEGRPRLFDQGMPGFLMGSDSPEIGYLSVLLLPDTAAAALEARALDNALALQLLGSTYSANAHAFSTRYQNCNQWVAELLALSWGGVAVSAEGPGTAPRAAAQAWLQAAGYVPTSFDVGNPVLLRAISALPWLHSDDHPADDLAQARFRVSMPASIDAFVRTRVPGVQRLEFCHRGTRVVLRRGWEPVAEGCEPGAGDTVLTLE